MRAYRIPLPKFENGNLMIEQHKQSHKNNRVPAPCLSIIHSRLGQIDTWSNLAYWELSHFGYEKGLSNFDTTSKLDTNLKRN
jgi:hypothetical protein